jgi:hypothetical protein
VSTAFSVHSWDLYAELCAYKSCVLSWLFSPQLSISIYLFLQNWGLNSRHTPWATLPALFFCAEVFFFFFFFFFFLGRARCAEFFWDRVLRTICLGWLWSTVLLISASWVAKITGVSHCCLAQSVF